MILPAGPAHAAALAAVHAAAFPPEERWDETAFGAQLGLPGTFGFLHRAGGMVLARAAAGEAEVLTLAIAPEARRQGIASALLGEALREAARRGAAEAFLEVAETNGPARALYEAAGFAPVGRRPAYYAGGAAALVLHAKLSGAVPP